MNSDEDGRNVGDSLTTPVEEVHQPSASSREEPPRPIGPMLNKEQIVVESLEIITSYLRNINTQKHYLASMAFMMHSMLRLLDTSREHEGRLNAFLVNDDKLQTKWFLTYHRILPSYGDYTLVLKDDPGAVRVNEMPSPIKQSILKELADDVMHNMYAGALQVKSQRSLDLKINSKLDSMREMSHEDAFPFYTWLKLMAKEIGHEDTLENKFFEVSSFLDFLNYSSVSETG